MSIATHPFVHIDRGTVLAVNRLNLRPSWARLFAWCSRLGDGVWWYCLMGMLPLVHGRDGLVLAATLAVMGLASTLVYKLLKGLTRRPRPCHVDLAVHTTVAPLDHFSFPSGHTLHAVGFTVLTVLVQPAWAIVLVPFTVLVALSRLVLGLHWPSDVLAGAAIGGVAATVAWQVGAGAAWW